MTWNILLPLILALLLSIEICESSSERFSSLTTFITGRERCKKMYHMSSSTTAWYSSKKLSFDDALKFCHDFGATLPQPKTSREQNALELQNNEVYYIGAKKDNESGHHRWLDGSSFEEDYLKRPTKKMWRTHEPSGGFSKTCVLSKYNTWSNVDCKERHYFACEKCISVTDLDNCQRTYFCLCQGMRVPFHFVCSSLTCKLLSCITLHESEQNKNSSSLIPCKATRWGEDCKFICMCKDLQPCHVETGECSSSFCYTGWTGPPSCNRTACNIRRWGENCDKDCYCADGQACDQKSGICFNGCPEGAGGTSCTDPSSDRCPSGQFLEDKTCRSCHCFEGTYCSAHTGLCLSDRPCQLGWEGSHCKNLNLCPKGKWGDNCEFFCACKDDHQCNKETGACPVGCIDRWTGSACDNPYCPSGQYGIHCDHLCVCATGFCDLETGACMKREFVWLNEVCSHDPLRFGPVRGGRTCDYRCFNDHCAKCDPNSAGTLCTECSGNYSFSNGTCEYRCHGDRGQQCSTDCSQGCLYNKCDPNIGQCTKGCKRQFWGERCERGCGHCLDGACSDDEGFCFGDCEAGFKGMRCDTLCPDFYYGNFCSNACSPNCRGPCEKISGVCLRCPSGYRGLHCEITTSDYGRFRVFGRGLLFDLLICSLPVFLIIIIISICCAHHYKCYCWKAKETEKKETETSDPPEQKELLVREPRRVSVTDTELTIKSLGETDVDDGNVYIYED